LVVDVFCVLAARRAGNLEVAGVAHALFALVNDAAGGTVEMPVGAGREER
jgi:hypothetical protein